MFLWVLTDMGVAFDPNDPDTMYMEIQGGELVRYNRKSEEALDIQPQPGHRRCARTAQLGFTHSRQSPCAGATFISVHKRLWRSDDRGDSWRPLSGDLTRNQNRLTLEIMGRVWSVDALYDHRAMSLYNTLTAISESPVEEDVLYTGSDDGLVYVSENGGGDWRRASTLPRVPETAFINDLEASLHDADHVFVVADAHKVGDYSPYIFESVDRGRSWRSISGDLPNGVIVWAIQQDHVDPDLLFAATEIGLYVSTNHGANWTKLAGAPTIAFRDLKIHRRDEDLVGATFGRGVYILDDYTALRDVADGALEKEAVLFPVRDAWWYVPYRPMQAKGRPTLGSTNFVAANPPFWGAADLRI